LFMIPVLSSRLAVLVSLSAIGAALHAGEPAAYDRAAAIRADLLRAGTADVLVTAHRSDWRNAPENSFAAIRRAIRMGVDIIEVDVRRTKDGRFVIIHDRTLDRTTTGKGLVENFSLAEIRALRLLAATGHPTDERVPTLEEVLDAVRGKALINLDKSYDHPEEIFAVVEACHAVDYALFSINERLDAFEQRHPGFLRKVLFMIVVPLGRPDAKDFIDEYLLRSSPAAVQVTFDKDTQPIVGQLRSIRERGVRLWTNSIWPEQNGGHDDERALEDPEGAYGWLLNQGVGIIQTDRPVSLLEYLRIHGRRR
jgi:glycerophosphoryl diester phosphodiesterase